MANWLDGWIIGWLDGRAFDGLLANFCIGGEQTTMPNLV
jgi:hypothetical protein